MLRKLVLIEISKFLLFCFDRIIKCWFYVEWIFSFCSFEIYLSIVKLDRMYLRLHFQFALLKPRVCTDVDQSSLPIVDHCLLWQTCSLPTHAFALEPRLHILPMLLQIYLYSFLEPVDSEGRVQVERFCNLLTFTSIWNLWGSLGWGSTFFLRPITLPCQ